MHPQSKAIVVLLASALFFVSCSWKKHNIACQAHLYSAYYSFQKQEFDKSIREVELAHEHSQHLRLDDWCVVEAYDDAGLYYFITGNIEQSRIYQSVAVLLAYLSPEHEKMYPFYLGNLGNIYSRLGMEEEYNKITRDPTILLKDPTVMAHRHVKQKFRTSRQP